MTPASSPPVERILAIGLRRLLQWAIPLSAVGLAFKSPTPGEGLFTYSLVHLVLIQVATLALAVELAPLTDHPWFTHLRRPWLASVASLVASLVGFAALLTLATSAAARYDPSLQFLQLLSSLDIAWVVAALYLGVRRMWGKGLAKVLGTLLLAGCVTSIAIYLKVVGFTAAGGWVVDGATLWRIVIPADTFSAIISVAVLLAASSRVDQRTAQPRPQS
jgi:hypothetical protein